MTKIYLAGKMNGLTYSQMNDWRCEMYNKLFDKASYCNKKIKIINPVLYYNFEKKRHQTEIEVEEFDLAHVISSDIIIVNLEGLNDSIGTIVELHDAHYHNKIPVIAFGKNETYENLHPWVKNNITRVEKNMDNVVSYINDFYFI